MQVKLLRDARVTAHAGDIVDVSPAEAGFLLSLGVAVEVVLPERAAQDSPEPEAPKKTTKRK